MNKAYIEGFTKKAQEAGLTVQQAQTLLKQAGMDPSMMAAAGGAGAGPGQSPTGDPSAGGPPGQGAPPDPTGGQGGAAGMAAGGGGMGVPPELEQMLQSLPPEVLQQLVQEIQAELGNGGQGGAGAPPGGDPSQGGGDPSQMAAMMGGAGGPPGGGAGGPPPPHGGHHKSGAAILAKQAGYIEGFIERGLSHGFNTQTTRELYKKALETIEGNNGQNRQLPKPKLTDKQAAHYAGFMERAAASGISKQEAHKTYFHVYGK